VPVLDQQQEKVCDVRLYSWLACTGTVLGILRVPSITTPPTSRTSPGFRPSVLPPVSAARSTITEPGHIRATISLVTRIGARRPGTAAVVITTSAAAHRSPS